MAAGRLAFGFDGEIGTSHHIKGAAGHRARHGDHRPETISGQSEWPYGVPNIIAPGRYNRL
jgi:hypothetical protein